MKLVQLQGLVKEELSTHISLSKCARVKAMVYNKLVGLYSKEYAMLHDYAKMIE